ncbi:MAG: HAMP domain-containing histidine kinase [Erysipelotrichaceae bacterium]|nr:HAMP domain-containing histidine kinase [Erysipelotrichaceae bacterium]MBO4538215.1 HAMP domain-containing histidine kinase [Erysipelotrichaceae bacterium]MBR5048630.1 HAMP domain-containing histidine kinase [Erysipelotrichaceae bacterium]
MKKTNLFNSLRFKSWSYFVLFALSILLLLQFFQLIFIEPFYKRTLRNELRKLNSSITSIYFTTDEETDVNGQINSLIGEKNACILIYNRDTGKSVGYDALGEGECAIYQGSAVNHDIIDQLDQSEEESIFLEGQLVELANRDVMVYGTKYANEEQNYLIFSNFPLETTNYLTETMQSQFLILSLLVLTLSLLISLLFSRIISEPIVSITNEARKLTYGDFDLHFENSEITEVDQLAQTLDLAASEIEKVEDLRKELMSNVSHDIKTPLTMIKAYAEMIKDISGDNREKRNEHLDVIINETDSLSRLVNDMLDLSRLQADAVSMKIEPFDLSTEIIEAARRFQSLADKEGVTIELDCDPELIALGDNQRINEVLYNFISNALKHYGDDRKIIISGKFVDKSTIRVEIIDHGPGIEEENLPYIWDRYFKIDRQYRRSQAGTGLGLAINKAILEDHKSNYGVISTPGEGSTFYFELQAYEVN